MDIGAAQLQSLMTRDLHNLSVLKHMWPISRPPNPGMTSSSLSCYICAHLSCAWEKDVTCTSSPAYRALALSLLSDTVQSLREPFPALLGCNQSLHELKAQSS